MTFLNLVRNLGRPIASRELKPHELHARIAQVQAIARHQIAQMRDAGMNTEGIQAVFHFQNRLRDRALPVAEVRILLGEGKKGSVLVNVYRDG